MFILASSKVSQISPKRNPRFRYFEAGFEKIFTKYSFNFFVPPTRRHSRNIFFFTFVLLKAFLIILQVFFTVMPFISFFFHFQLSFFSKNLVKLLAVINYFRNPSILQGFCRSVSLMFCINFGFWGMLCPKYPIIF